MFSEPIGLTYNAVAKNLVRIGSGVDFSDYRLVDGTTAVYNLKIGHAFKTRSRIFLRLQRDAYAADPIVPAQNLLTGAVSTLTVDYLPVGTSATDARNLALALVGFATSGNLDKALAGEV